MSLQAVVVPHIPAETRRVAQRVFCKGNRYMQMRDELGVGAQGDICLFRQGAKVGQDDKPVYRLASLLTSNTMF